MKLISTTAALMTSFLITQVTSAPLGTTKNDNGSNGSSIAIKHVKRMQCPPDTLPYVAYYDDARPDLPLEYIGDWTHLSNQGAAFNDGTLSYTGQANAMVLVPTPFPDGIIYNADVTIWSSSKSDRGEFSVYLGTRLLGTGNQYTSASTETGAQLVFHLENVQLEGGLPFVIKNDKGAPFMAFDSLTLDYCVS